MDKNSMIAIGISSKDCKQNESFLPGFKVGSFGLLNTGYLYCGDPATPIRFKENLSISTSFTTGDVIGCGYHQITKQVYWTKNGTYLGVAEGGKSRFLIRYGRSAFATIGFGSKGTIVEANFGTEKFLFKPEEINEEIQQTSEMNNKLSKLIKKVEKLGNLTRLKENLFSLKPIYADSNFSLLSTIAQFSLSLQLLYRTHLFFHKGYTILHLTDANQVNQLKDVTFRFISAIIPEKTFGFNLSNCLKLSPSFPIGLRNTNQITILNLSSARRMDEQTAEFIVEYFPNLKYLRMWEHCTDKALVSISALNNLVSIDLTDCNEITNVGVQYIIKKITMITTLILDGCIKLNDELLNFIIKTKKNLEKIQMEHCYFTEKAMIKLIKNSPALVSISVAGNASHKMDISDHFISEICVRGSLLRALNLYRAPISKASMHLITKHCKLLEEINLGHVAIPDESIARLSKLTNLKRIELLSTSITDKTLSMLFSYLSIEEMSLQRCSNITNSGIFEIIPSLSECQYLCLKSLPIEDNIIYQIANSPPSFIKLKRLDIRGTPVSKEAVHDLMEKFPKLHIFSNYSRITPLIEFRSLVPPVWNYPTSRISTVRQRKKSL